MKTMQELRKEDPNNNRILYHINFWDGPISGVCLYELHIS